MDAATPGGPAVLAVSGSLVAAVVARGRCAGVEWRALKRCRSPQRRISHVFRRRETSSPALGARRTSMGPRRRPRASERQTPCTSTLPSEPASDPSARP
eukprot:573079-Rhodomonas_salina.1